MRYAAQRLGLIAAFAVLLLGAAGDARWLRGWVYVASALALETATLLILALRAPETLAQRGKAHSGVEPWDKPFAILWLVLGLGATPVVAGCDAVRFAWSSMPAACILAGEALLLAGGALATWAMLANEHFEQLVRIQTDRGHRVVSEGPYRMVRHPGYAGAILALLGTPLILGSWWTFVPAGALAMLFAARTALEDATLRRGLAGYERYAASTRFRLVPGLW